MIIIIGLIMLQPDIGTSVIIMLIAGSIILSTNIRFRHLFLLLFAGVVVTVLAIPNMVTEKRIARITGAYLTFYSSYYVGYHLIHSFFSIGYGIIIVHGLGQSD